MTYKEAYTKCKTKEELFEMTKHDAAVAMFLGSHDRLKVIEVALNEVMKAKDWSDEE